jgi:integrating conjugative element membrane protein (TIGR03747 family)
MASSSSANAQDRRTSIFGFLTLSITIIIASLILSIIVEWVGMNFWWEDEGSTHSLDMIATEIEYINKDFRENNVLGYSPVDVINYAYTTFYDADNEGGAMAKIMNWINRSDSADDSAVSTFARQSGRTIKEYALAAFYITLVFTIRLSVLILSLPLFILVTVIALVDGLAQRDVRRWTNGRESGLRYHYMKSLALPAFFGTWLIYLSIPISIHPNFIILPLALFYGFIIREAVSWFKKYL